MLAWLFAMNLGTACPALAQAVHGPDPVASADEQTEPPFVSAPGGNSRPRERHSRGIAGSFGMVGINLSGTLGREAGSGLVLGAEGSLVVLNPALFWWGGYVDVLYAFAADEVRLSLGPEVGIGWLGLDAGYVLSSSQHGSPQHGLAVRPLLTIGIASAFFRSAWSFGAQADWSCEIGVLLKFPIEL
jgi:hypothetical protein